MTVFSMVAALSFLLSFQTVIHAKREEFQQNKGKLDPTKRKAFLDLLLTSKDGETGTVLTDEDIREEVDTFMFEGHDTTSAAMAWSLYLVGQHPEVMTKIQEEQDQVMGDKQVPDYNDLQKMNYLGMVIKEALRLFPSVPIIGRELEYDTEISGYMVPKGVTIAVLPYILHRNPKVCIWLWELCRIDEIH